jgi:hypothetical protein
MAGIFFHGRRQSGQLRPRHEVFSRSWQLALYILAVVPGAIFLLAYLCSRALWGACTTATT